MSDHKDLALLVRAGQGLIAVQSHEEARLIALFRRVVSEVWRPLYSWSAASGLKRLDLEQADFGKRSEAPEDVLSWAASQREPMILLLLDFHPYLSNPSIVRTLRELSDGHEDDPHTVVLVSPALDLPAELQRLAAAFEPRLPGEDKIETMVKELAFEWSQRNAGRRVKVSRRAMSLLIKNLAGLTLRDARRLAANAIEQDGAITEADLPRVMSAKFELLNRGGVLQFELETASIDDIAGLENLKHWLALRRRLFADNVSTAGLPPPRGLLLLGVQGCGKSLAAKACAGGLGVPLLRFDFAAIYDKYHGETERKLRESLQVAELMAPCVLWIDEIEKAVATSSSDDGVSRRVLGHLLTWMAEREQPVFLVATANDVSQLPPELLRKGRFDEIFFVDLPSAPVRAAIFKLQFAKRNLDASQFDVDALAAHSDGFSGAEIEQAVVSALYSAHGSGTVNATPDQALLLEELARTRPLSVLMADRIEALRRWAAPRTVPAAA